MKYNLYYSDSDSPILINLVTIAALAMFFYIFIVASGAFSQTPTYTLTVTNDQQIDGQNYEFDIYLLRTGGTAFEYANNSQYFININPAIINGGTLTFIISSGTCELNAVQQILPSKVSFDAVNNRLRIAAHSPSGAGTGTIISSSGLGTRLGRFKLTNTVTFAAAQANLSWYNGPSGFYTKVFAYVAANNVEITNPASHFINIFNPPLPVVLSSFDASVNKNDVKLTWVTESEINNSGFNVERTSVRTLNWENIGFIQGSGTTTSQKHYSFDDRKLQTANYKYRLKQLDYNGNFEYFNLANDVEVGKPKEFTVSQNYPNPSNPKSRIDYQIPVSGKVTIKLYDIIGREVMTLIDKEQDAGYYVVEFDGTNLASGLYFYRVQTLNFTVTKKMALIK